MSFTGNYTCNVFLSGLMNGDYDFTTDTFKIALYTGSADIGANTTAYTDLGETSGTGYDAGGQRVYVSVTPTSANNSYGVPTAYISFNNVSWTSASFTARGALIYNASKGNKSIGVLNFGLNQTTLNQDFRIQFPFNNPETALVRIT